MLHGRPLGHREAVTCPGHNGLWAGSQPGQVPDPSVFAMVTRQQMRSEMVTIFVSSMGIIHAQASDCDTHSLAGPCLNSGNSSSPAPFPAHCRLPSSSHRRLALSPSWPGCLLIRPAAPPAPVGIHPFLARQQAISRENFFLPLPLSSILGLHPAGHAVEHAPLLLSVASVSPTVRQRMILCSLPSRPRVRLWVNGFVKAGHLPASWP